LLSSIVACGGDDQKNSSHAAACQAKTNAGCANGQVCEDTDSGALRCFDPITLTGTVTNAINGKVIAGAIVVARDANGAAVSGTATTNAEGKYSLPVPVKRDANGNPAASVAYTLRADAAQYQTFPTAPRVALPIQVTPSTTGPIESTATAIALLPLPAASGTGTISGKVSLDAPAGTLVVAGNATALAAIDGTFTIFNVPAGSINVTAYRQGVNIDPATVTVAAGATVSDVRLSQNAKSTVSVSGKVEIVNPGAGKDTSVILVVADTFVADAARGESPPGLRVAKVAGDFSIQNVPDGNYVVLAAFENDNLVRDPDTCIGGTDIVTVTVTGSDVSIAESFKITGALDVVSPDAEQIISGNPTLSWVDDSSEDYYTVALYDAFGVLVWENKNVASVSGAKTVSLPYAGPALVPGMYYQYRASSIRKNNCAISRTEDLRGVFQVR
jgi:hypothetical protein